MAKKMMLDVPEAPKGYILCETLRQAQPDEYYWDGLTWILNTWDKPTLKSYIVAVAAPQEQLKGLDFIDSLPSPCIIHYGTETYYLGHGILKYLRPYTDGAPTCARRHKSGWVWESGARLVCMCKNKCTIFVIPSKRDSWNDIF